MERFEKKQYSLKMYILIDYQYEKNTVRVSRNQPSVPCFKPLKMCMAAPEPLLLDFMCQYNQPIVAVKNLF